ncbi:MAG: hypothetical protein DRH11_08680 [Deltaproteobacteria bacterium]|nr:MAG: hypothetical protein DRH11_08680 [Deltaproteobacteria bacterium]
MSARKKLKYKLKNIVFCFVLVLLLHFLVPDNILSAETENQEQTYSISLVKEAEADKRIQEVDNKKVLTELYTVQKGDRIWQLFRERGLLQKRNLAELLAVLKRLNKSLTNLDLIYPGEKILIPLTIAPIKGVPTATQKAAEAITSLEELKNVKLENYTVKKGDSLTKVVLEKYKMPPEKITDEYLALLAKLNPNIEDINLIHPGQVVRLPIYSPQVVRLPVKPKKTIKPEGKVLSQTLESLRHQLGEVFSMVGEEWVDSGEHFIPLKSGGQIRLKADSFPVLNLSSGIRVIVDLSNALPERMSDLITSSWKNYRIVHLSKNEDLRDALDEVLPLCEYRQVSTSEEPLELEGDIPVKITADWIFKRPSSLSGKEEETVSLTLLKPGEGKTPDGVKNFLAASGIKVVEYPPPKNESPTQASFKVDLIKPGAGVRELVENVLSLVGQSYNKDVEIPIYRDQKRDYNLIVRADFFLRIGGRESIVDISGLGQEITSLLKDHGFYVLALAGEKNPLLILFKILTFLGVPFDADPHVFLAANREASRNITLRISGITFRDSRGEDIFATKLDLPEGVAGFLSQKSYHVLSLSPSPQTIE